MNKKASAVLALSLILGLAIGSSAQAASPSAKPTLASKKKPAVATAKEGTATHEMSEASTGTGEEGSQKVAKAKTSVIKKKPAPKASPKK
jgi:hypothetical protein